MFDSNGEEKEDYPFTKIEFKEFLENNFVNKKEELSITK